MADTGSLRFVIDRRVPLADVVAAMRHLTDGHARDKIVVRVIFE